ncbi:MAG: hypothetical protein ACTSU2_04725 [Promethearchaeota archaeon]
MAFGSEERIQGYGLIIISKQAYLTIAKHVLSHAGPKIPDKNEWREVMGLLVGRIIVGNCEISEAVPFAEGGHDDVKFGYEEYVKVAALEEQYYLRDPPEFFAGWYHSHFIGHTFSGVDILNHLGWQTDNNPYAFGLVFDPQELSEDNPGFCVIRLEDHRLGEGSQLEYLDYVIQIPKRDRQNYIEFLKRELPEVF